MDGVYYCNSKGKVWWWHFSYSRKSNHRNRRLVSFKVFELEVVKATSFLSLHKDYLTNVSIYDNIFKISLVFYKRKDGKKPAGEFINSLTTEMKAKVIRDIDLLEKYGFNLGKPYVKKIQGKKYDKLYELRSKFSNNISRIFYFFETKAGIVVLSGYLKKSNKTDKKELDRALGYMNDYLERSNSDE